MAQNIDEVFKSVEWIGVRNPSWEYLATYLKSDLPNATSQEIFQIHDKAKKIKDKSNKSAWAALKLMCLMFIITVVIVMISVHESSNIRQFWCIPLLGMVISGSIGLYFDQKRIKAARLERVSSQYQMTDSSFGGVPAPIQIEGFCQKSKQADDWRVTALEHREFLTIGDVLAIEALGSYALSRIISSKDAKKIYQKSPMFIEII